MSGKHTDLIAFLIMVLVYSEHEARSGGVNYDRLRGGIRAG